MNTNRVLIVDDEPDLCELLALSLSHLHIKSDIAYDISSAKQQLESTAYTLCLTDMRLPDGNGLELISFVSKNVAQTPIAMITAHGNMDTAIEALKRGAFDFLTKPIELDQLNALVSSAMALSERPLAKDKTSMSKQLLGNSNATKDLRKILAKVARSQAPVFIHGESGSGKEVAAKIIHQHSARSEGPFIAVNCGAIPSELVESEFFGHKKGSFTGATHDKTGLFAAANGGTLLLDEIADLPLTMQVKLLRAIQEKTVKPIGSNHEIAFDVRILSATHKNLAQLVDANLFRNDLFYRINVIEVFIPPLRDRLDDIEPIAEKMLAKLSSTLQTGFFQLAPSALDRLKSYRFPGNIRELENTLERTLALCENNIIEANDLLFQTSQRPEDTSENSPNTPIDSATNFHSIRIQSNNTQTNDEKNVPLSHLRSEDESLDVFLQTIEKEEILKALHNCRWNKTNTAKYLGISFRSLRYRMQKLDIDE